MAKKRAARIVAPAPAAVVIPQHPVITVVGPSVKRVQAACEKYKAMLLGLPGVVRVSYGCKSSGGSYGFENGAAERTVRYAILIYVKAKKERKKGMIPADIGGIPTDIVEEPELKTATANGVVTLHDGTTTFTGTLGVIGIKAGPSTNGNRFYGITNAHVACGPAMRPEPGHVLDVKLGAAVAANLDPNQTVLSGFMSPNSSFKLDCASIPLDGDFTEKFGFIDGLDATAKSKPFDMAKHSQVKMFSRMQNRIVLGHVITDDSPPRSIDMGNGSHQTLARLLRIGSLDTSQHFGDKGDSGSIIVSEVKGALVAVGLYLASEDEDKSIGLAHWLRRKSNGIESPESVMINLGLNF